MRQSKDQTERLAKSIMNVKEKIILCAICHGISEHETCNICSDPSRVSDSICVVEEPYDVFVLENVGEYRGSYHVLMGAISPLDGIGPDDLTIDALKERIQAGDIKEVIVATNPNMEGESTAVYLARILKPMGVKVTRIARGLPVGADLEYADPVTLLKSLEGRREME